MRSEVQGFWLHPDLSKEQLHCNSLGLNVWGLKAQAAMDWALKPSMSTVLIRLLHLPFQLVPLPEAVP